MKCPICENSNYSRISYEYKFEILEDQKYFGDLKIACCEKCDFNFAFPMPSEENLNYFYKKFIDQKIDHLIGYQILMKMLKPGT